MLTRPPGFSTRRHSLSAPGFKSTDNFVRYATLGAKAANAVPADLKVHGHEAIELERFALSHKVWQTRPSECGCGPSLREMQPWCQPSLWMSAPRTRALGKMRRAVHERRSACLTRPSASLLESA